MNDLPRGPMQPLHAPEGAFDAVTRRARGRRTRTAVLAVGLCVAVATTGVVAALPSVSGQSQDRLIPADPTVAPTPDQTQPPSPALVAETCTAAAIDADVVDEVKPTPAPMCHDEWAVASVVVCQECLHAGRLFHFVDGRWTQVGDVLQDCAEHLIGQGVPRNTAAAFYSFCFS